MVMQLWCKWLFPLWGLPALVFGIAGCVWGLCMAVLLAALWPLTVLLGAGVFIYRELPERPKRPQLPEMKVRR